jgi:FtsZ-binding cell division protein ZapB
MSIESIEGLDIDAWNRWVAYRQAIKKPLKEVSMAAAALKLSRYGKDQAEVVDQSISQQWQGLFDLKKKRDPSEPPQKTDKQKAADDARFNHQLDSNQKMWRETLQTPLGKLRLCDALLARYLMTPDDPQLEERLEWLKHTVGDLMREVDIKLIARDAHLIGMASYFYGGKAIDKLRESVREVSDDKQGAMAA